MTFNNISLATTLQEVRISESTKLGRLVLTSDEKPNYTIFTLSRPHRLIIDFKNTNLSSNLQLPKVHGIWFTDLRAGYPNKNILRIAVNLSQQALPHHFLLKKNKQHNYRIVIDFKAKRRNLLVTPKPVEILPPANQQKRDIVVVIDPGHGGKDPGASGIHGIHEKNIVLKISRFLQQDLNQTAGVKALLTRNGDYYLTLRQRLLIARKDKADFFVAIHADAFYVRNARGASVFALSERGATSEAARWLAEKENYSELGGVYLANKSYLLRSVLIDLSQTATISQSLQIGNIVLRQLANITHLHHNAVEQARFVVLKSPDIPSLLIETGFISNPLEEARLRNPRNQQQLATAIAKGIISYFKVHAPPGTLFAYLNNLKVYRVQRGDNLTIIAARFGVGINALKQANHLTKNMVFVGQILRIPGNS